MPVDSSAASSRALSDTDAEEGQSQLTEVARLRDAVAKLVAQEAQQSHEIEWQSQRHFAPRTLTATRLRRDETRQRLRDARLDLAEAEDALNRVQAQAQESQESHA